MVAECKNCGCVFKPEDSENDNIEYDDGWYHKKCPKESKAD